MRHISRRFLALFLIIGLSLPFATSQAPDISPSDLDDLEIDNELLLGLYGYEKYENPPYTDENMDFLLGLHGCRKYVTSEIGQCLDEEIDFSRNYAVSVLKDAASENVGELRNRLADLVSGDMPSTLRDTSLDWSHYGTIGGDCGEDETYFREGMVKDDRWYYCEEGSEDVWESEPCEEGFGEESGTCAYDHEFTVQRTDESDYDYELVVDEYDVKNAGDLDESGDQYYFNVEPGAVYSFTVYEEDLDDEKTLSFQAPDFDLVKPSLAAEYDEELEFRIENYDGGGEFDAKSSIGFEDIENRTESVEEVMDELGRYGVTAYAEDNTPGDGIRVTKTEHIWVGDGFTQDLLYPGAYNKRYSISQDWDVYMADDVDDLEYVEYEDWQVASWRPSVEDEGMEFKIDSNSDDVIEVRASLTDDGYQVERMRFELKTDWDADDPATVSLRDSGEEQASFDTIGMGGFYTYELERSDYGYQVTVFDENGNEVQDEIVSIGSIDTIGFRVEGSENDDRARKMAIRYVFTEQR